MAKKTTKKVASKAPAKKESTTGKTPVKAEPAKKPSGRAAAAPSPDRKPSGRSPAAKSSGRMAAAPAPDKKPSGRAPAVKSSASQRTPAVKTSASGRLLPVERVTGDDIVAGLNNPESPLNQRLNVKRNMVEMSRGKEPIELHHRPLTKGELVELRNKMLERLADLNSDLASMEDDLTDKNIRVSAGTDPVDQSSAQYEQEFKLERAESEASEISLIRRALAKMDGRLAGMEYGRCEATGVWISIQRLKAIPHARLCVAAVEKFEREGGGEEYGVMPVGA